MSRGERHNEVCTWVFVVSYENGEGGFDFLLGPDYHYVHVLSRRIREI